MARLRPNMFAAAIAALAPDAALAQATPLAKDLETFIEWLPGRYDNEQQVFWDADAKVPESERAPRIDAIIRPVEASALGAYVFLLASRQSGDPARLLALTADEAAGAIRMQILTPVRPGTLPAGAGGAPELKGIKLSAMTTDAGCDILWRRRLGQFEGRIADPACAARAGASLAPFGADPALAAGELWSASLAPLKLKKVRPFECWTAVLKGARHGDSGVGLSDWEFRRGGLIHDQGGELTIVTGEQPPREIRLRLRRVEWPAGPKRPSLTLYVHEGSEARAVSYSWAEEDATRIGINLRWVQASCTHAPTRVFDLP